MGHILSTCNPSRRSRNTAKARRLTKAGTIFYLQFRRSGALTDIENAITNFQQAISLTPDDHPDKPEQLGDLSKLFRSRFIRTGALNDIEEAIRIQHQAISITPENHPSKPTYLANLGDIFGNRFEYTGLLDDIEGAIRNQRQALSLTPDGHPRKSVQLRKLGNLLLRQFEHTGALDDVEEALRNQQQAVMLTPDGHPQRLSCLSGLGAAFLTRFRSTGIPSDLQSAIESFRQVVLLTPDDRPSKPTRLNGLGISLLDQFECTGVLSSLEEAIEHLQRAVLLTPYGHLDKSTYLSNLGNSFLTRFECTGMLSDMEGALESQKHAVLLTADSHTGKPDRLSNLAKSFGTRFKRTGSLNNLEEAIKYQQQALSLIPDGHPHKPGYLNNLGIYLGHRFERTGVMTDLEEAIENKRLAVSLTPDDHPHKPRHLTNLGSELRNRFYLTGMQKDIEEAVKIQQQAVLLTPDGHFNRPLRLTGLGIAFQTQFESTGVLKDVENAIMYLQQAMSLTPDDHPERPFRLSTLGTSFQSRFEHTEALSDLEYAIENKQRAALLTPDGHPHKPWLLYNLALSFRSRFDRTGSLSDLDEAILHNRLAATSTVGSILLRSRASRQWARLETKRDPLSALVAYRQAIDLLPRLAWIGDPITTRHSELTNFGDLPREAAAFALDTGRPDLALEWLEQGRSVVWNQLLSLRTSVDDLRQMHPDLCAEFMQVSDHLRAAATRDHVMNAPNDVKILLEEETQCHHRLAEMWESLVEKIRALPGFEDFLLPKRLSVLKEAASSGPVVVINVHRRRCDALILNQGEDGVLHIPLQNLCYADLLKMRKILQEDLFQCINRGTTTTCSSPRLTGVLSKLYSSIVDPILKGLGLTSQTGGRSDPLNLPRIWWCPTGPLTFLPLHAACHETGAEIEGTFHYVVSSYTPTVNALREARATKKQPFERLVGVAMIDTPGNISLPSVEMEMSMIRELFLDTQQRRFEILQNEQATCDQVLKCMGESSWVHLACHAIQDEQEPTQSGFWLHDRRLTIIDIIAKSFGNADFAFLSACETATGDKKVSDEAMHITGAMLGAGYRNVIGTMWAIPDEAAPPMAKKVYEILLSGGEPNSDRAARALQGDGQKRKKNFGSE